MIPLSYHVPIDGGYIHCIRYPDHSPSKRAVKGRAMGVVGLGSTLPIGQRSPGDR